jgi:predicted small lipoprotein YifL
MESAMRRLIALLSALGAALSLSACGVRGDLERPGPIWGEDERTEQEREHEREDDDTDGEDR